MKERNQMRLLTDLLFTSDEEKIDVCKDIFSDEFNQADFLKLILQNGVFCRVYDIINAFVKDNNCNFSFSQSFEVILKREKNKQRAFLRGITFIQNIFQSHNIDMVVFKIDKYPDTGKDIDIYVGKDLKRAVQILIKNGMICNPSFYLKTFNRNILIHNNLNIPIIDLYSTFSRFHERWIPDADIFLSHKKELDIENVKISVTSSEDTLLIQCISTIYLMVSLDLSSMWVVYKKLSDENFDLSYFTTIVNEAGISLGVYYLLYIIKEVTDDEKVTRIMENINGSPFLKRLLTGKLDASSFPFFIPYLHIFLLYLHKIFSDISRRRIAQLIFLIIPFIASLIVRRRVYQGVDK